MHHARWMSKALYSLKIYIFREQINISKKDLDGLRKINIFIAVSYVKVWFTANKPEIAPRLDLEFIKDLINNNNIDKDLRRVALEKFTGNHLWYLSDTLVGLAFFDKSLSIDIKKKMAMAISRKPKEDQIIIRKIKKINKKSINDLSLEYFVNTNTKLFFDSLGIPTNFLNTDPLEWNDNDEYNSGYEIIKNLIVTNDNSERQIAAITDFSNLTKNEDVKQSLYMSVIHHRQTYPDCKKKTLM